MIGYLDEPEETERRFRNGAFLTQDRGYMSNGELFLVGRSKNTIIIRGRNYQGEDLERIVESVDGVDAGTAAAAGVDAGTTEELVVFAESRMSTDMHGDVTQNVRRRLWDEVGIAVRDVVLCPPGSLPRTGLGKLRRESLKKSYLEGSGK